MVVEGPLFIEISGRWEHCYCAIEQQDGSTAAPEFLAYERARLDLPPSLSNRSSIIVNFTITRGDCSAASTTVSMAVLSKLMRNKAVPASPSFFNVKVRELDESTTTYRFVTNSEEDRVRWIEAIRIHAKTRGGAEPRWATVPSPAQYATTASPGHAAMLISRVPTSVMRSPPRRESPSKSKDQQERDRADRRRRQKDLFEHEPTPDDVLAPTTALEANAAFDMDLDAEEDSESRILGTLKVANVVRFFQVISVFPFAAVLLALKASNWSVYFMRSLIFARLMNGLIFYAVPVVLVDVVMQRFCDDSWVQRVTVGLHVLAMTALVLYAALGELWAVMFTARVVYGTFSFKVSPCLRLSLHHYHVHLSNSRSFTNGTPTYPPTHNSPPGPCAQRWQTCCSSSVCCSTGCSAARWCCPAESSASCPPPPTSPQCRPTCPTPSTSGRPWRSCCGMCL